MSKGRKDLGGHDPDPSTSKGIEETTSSRSSSRSKVSSSPISGPDEERLYLRLASPVGGDTLTFNWPLREVSGYSEGQEILDVVRSTLSSFPELNFIVRQHCGLDLDSIDKRDFQEMSALLDAFNKTCPAITQLWKGATKPGGEIWSAERATPALLRQICTRAYNRAVDNVQLLNNHYKAFSSQTYGETSFERMQLIIQEITPKDRDVFVDLGSGVGQLIIHMAGGSKVKKAVGIEIASLPNRYAENLSVEFKKWMKWYGKKFRPFELHRGDFLDEKFRDIITKEATIILINNYAFTADLETRIKRELLSELKDGTRIISTKPYGHANRSTITDRHLNGSRRSSTSSKTSRDSIHCWSRESSASLTNRSNTPNGRRATTPASTRSGTPLRERTPTLRSVNKRQDASYNSDDDDEHAIGPTTRSKWQEYCSTKIRKHATTPSVCSEKNSRESKWSSSKSDYAPPKKARKTGQRGRPRKFPIITKLIAEETKETIDLMHQMTCTAFTRPASPVHDSSLILTTIRSPDRSTVTPPATQTPPKVEIFQQSKYPALNQMFESMRMMFEAQLEKMKASNFADEVKAQIEAQKSYQALLRSRIDAMYKQITQLRSAGISNFYARLEELGIEATTPSLLLENAKEIVAHHKKITAECAALESEITALEMSNQQLEVKVRRREDADSASNTGTTNSVMQDPSGQLISSICAANSLILADSLQVLAAHNKNLLNRLAHLSDKTESNGKITDGSKQTLEEQVPLQSDHKSVPLSSNAATYNQQTCGQPSQGSVSVGAVTHKRPRQRQARASSRKTSSGANKQASDPKEDEEMERKIQDIVAKALEVDSAAKCAEKERRARGDKRKEKIANIAGISGRSADDATATSTIASNTTSLERLNSTVVAISTQASVEGAVSASLKAESDSARSGDEPLL